MKRKNKRSIVVIGMLVMGLLSACKKQEEFEVKTFIPNETYVKTIGRTYLNEDILWLALSGTGAEFTVTGKKAEVTFVGDNIATTMNKDNHARVAIYLNGERVVDDMIDAAEKTYTVFESEEEQSATIQIIKLSETAMSTVGIKDISVLSTEDIKPAKKKEHRIEFIGDSITCGYGVDDEDKDHHFSTSTEDVTKAFAYKTAQNLDADYSIVSISGYGIISGYSDGEKKMSSSTIPQYYDKLGFSYGNFARTIKVDSLEWDFSKYEPEVIVINLGTNDDSYCQDDTDRQEDYKDGYVDFLKQIRAKNPDSTILCTLGMMGDRLYPSIEKAVEEYKQETNDTNIDVLKFDVQSSEDGYAADWHPSAKTHDKAATKLTDKIKVLMGW